MDNEQKLKVEDHRKKMEQISLRLAKQEISLLEAAKAEAEEIRRFRKNDI